MDMVGHAGAKCKIMLTIQESMETNIARQQDPILYPEKVDEPIDGMG
jgi:hypothetical protein